MPDLNMGSGLEKLEKKLEHLWKRRRATATQVEDTIQSPLSDVPGPSLLETQRFPQPSFIRPTSTRMVARQDTFMGRSGRRTRSLPDPSTNPSTSELPIAEPAITTPGPSSSLSPGSTGPGSAPGEPSESPKPRVTYSPFPPRLDIPRRSSSLSPLQRASTSSLAELLEFNFEGSSGPSTRRKISPVPSPRTLSRSSSRSPSRPILTAESSKRASEATIKMAISTDTLRPVRSRTPGPPPLSISRYSGLWDGHAQQVSRETRRPISTETLRPISTDTLRLISSEMVKPTLTGNLDISSKEPPIPVSTEISTPISTATSRPNSSSGKEPLDTQPFRPTLTKRPSTEALSPRVTPRPSLPSFWGSSKSPQTPELGGTRTLPPTKLRLQIPEPETSPSLVPLPQSARSDRTVSSYGPVTPTAFSRPMTPMVTLSSPSSLGEPTLRDFLSLTDDDVADPDVTASHDQPGKQPPPPPQRAAPSPPPSCGLPPNPPVFEFPIPPTFKFRPQRSSGESDLIILPPPLASQPNAGAAAAIEAVRIATRYRMDLVYVVNLWPKKVTGYPKPTNLPVRRKASHSSLSTSTTVVHRPRAAEDYQLDGRLMAANGLHLVPSPFKFPSGVLKKVLQTEGWLEYRGDNASEGGSDPLEGFVRGYSQAFFTNNERNRGIVFAAYRRPRVDGSHAILTTAEMEQMARDAEALCSMLVDQANSERRMRANA